MSVVNLWNETPSREQMSLDPCKYCNSLNTSKYARDKSAGTVASVCFDCGKEHVSGKIVPHDWSNADELNESLEYTNQNRDGRPLRLY
jgi:hypothetical protein